MQFLQAQLSNAQAHPDAVVPNQGPLVAWTAGFVGPKEDDNIPPEVRVYSELGSTKGDM